MGQGESLVLPTAIEKPEIEHEKVARLKRMLNIRENENLVREHRGPIPVLDLPILVGESCIGDGRMAFSIRGRDEALYHAYLNAFVRTWGPYVMFRESPDRFRNGEWSVIGWTSPSVWEAWYGPSEFSAECKEVFCTEKITTIK